MSGDKSATERAALDRQIERVERQEEEFSERRAGYARSVEQFREQFHAVGRDRETSLGERMHAGDSGAQHELQACHQLLSQIDRYVDETVDEVERTSSQVRQSSDDEREKLIAERNVLPWE